MNFDQEFDRCAGWIGAALEYSGGTHTLADVRVSIQSGNLQFWPGKAAVVVTEIEFYPQRRILHLFLAGGDLEELKLMLVDIEEFARRMKCSAVTLTGRKGWTRSFLKDGGYTEEAVLMAKEFTDGQG